MDRYTRKKIKRGGNLLLIALTFAAVLFTIQWIEKNRRPGSLEEFIERHGETPIRFSMVSGFYEEGFDLELDLPGKLPKGAAIYYTMDGTEPDESSACYDGPLRLEKPEGGNHPADRQETAEDLQEIEEASDEDLEPSSPTSGGMSDTAGASYDPQSAVFNTGVVTLRTKICLGEESTNSQYAVYAFGTDVLQGQDGYIFCLDSDPEGLYGYETGILVGGKDLAEKGSKYSGNYMKKGDDWVRPCHLAVFDRSGNLVMEQNIGLSVSGGMSRRLDQKSLNLDAGLPWGEEDGHFDLDIFDDLAQGDCAHVDSYTHLRLRARSQVTRSFREKLVGKLTEESGYRIFTEPVCCTVYLNGEFYMLAELEQTFSNSWIAHRFDLPDTDHIEKYKGKEVSVLRKMGLTDIFAADLTQEENQKALEAAVDMDDYLLYYAINILDNDLDWPRNNVEAWRYTGEYDPDRPYTDGRIRFMIYDSDKAFDPDPDISESFGTDSFVSMMENIKRGYESRFRDVMGVDKYRNRMITILCDLMNTSFETQHVLSLLKEIFAMAKEECDPYFTADYTRKVDENAAMALEAVPGYNDRTREDLRYYFGLDRQYSMMISAASGVEVMWNNMLVSPGEEYEGTYYKGVPIRLTAAALPGWTFDHWEINGEIAETENVPGEENNDPSQKDAPDSNVLTVDGHLLEDGSCTVLAVASREEGECVIIAEVSASGSDDWIRLYNAGAVDADLGRYCISDDPEVPAKFRLPAQKLHPGESCRILGSKNEIKYDDSLCSCNFMLSKNETLTLTPDESTGLISDSLRIPNMSQGCSYGRRNNGYSFCWFDNRKQH